jgi:hypothetical protein
MPEKSGETWLCPMCSLKRIGYGKNCEAYEAGGCENELTPNLTGVWYLNARDSIKDEVQAIGIGAISDEQNN